jgi:RsiW-degrading membrane proteinase PrsW (M82 family)
MAFMPESVRDRLYLVLPLAFIPLVLWPGQQTYQRLSERLQETIASAPPETKSKVALVYQDKDATFSDVLPLLPEGRLVGAHLAYNSRQPWAYAAIAAGTFWLLLLVLFPRRPGEAPPLHLLTVMLMTGTVGAMLLLAGQAVAGSLFFAASADMPQSVEPFTRQYLIGLIGFVVVAALFEEVGKLLPLFLQYAATGPLSWRAAALWGLAAGAGLGAMEGCLYAQSGYNGISETEVYVTRFISGVTLHAIWAAAAALNLHRHRREVANAENAVVLLGLLIHFALPTTALHAAYNLALTYGPGWSGAAVAILSFAWMAWQIETCRARELESARPAVVY